MPALGIGERRSEMVGLVMGESGSRQRVVALRRLSCGRTGVLGMKRREGNF